MKIFVCRHGNTFSENETPVWVGATSNPSLVPKGFAQAEALGNYFLRNGISFKRFYAGPLLRTTQFAERVAQVMHADQQPCRVDMRLSELHYGSWTGLSQNEVIAQFGEDEFFAWNHRSEWPEKRGWSGSHEEVRREIESFVSELISDPSLRSSDSVLVTSSQGKIRYFLSLIPGEWEKRVSLGQFKIKTGNFSEFEWTGEGLLLHSWDKNPSESAQVEKGQDHATPS